MVWPLYLAALLTVGWGVAHLFPTRNVVAGFGEISEDNRLILTMEWIVEAVALIFIGALVTLTALVHPQSTLALTVQIASAIALTVLAVVSFFTGFRINFLPYKLCPFLFMTSALLVVVATLG